MLSTTAAIALPGAMQLTLIGGLGDGISTRLWHMGGTRYPGVLTRKGRDGTNP